MAALQRVDRLFLALVGAAALIDGGIWLYVSLRQRLLPDVLPIHYSSAGQVDRVGLRTQLFILPGIGLITLTLNLALALAINRREPLLGYVLLAVSILVQLLLVGAAVQLIH